jgi:hypothetical protein
MPYSNILLLDTMDQLKLLDAQIQQIQGRLVLLKRARASLQQAEVMKTLVPSEETRFYNVRPLVAIRQVLTDRGIAVHEEELVQILLDGGIAINKKRARYNIEVSLRQTVKLGSLTRSKDGMIDLPERRQKKS